MSDQDNPFPKGSRVEVWWTGERQWYIATVTDTRLEPHRVKGKDVLCHELHCQYVLDGLEQWHSLHNNRVRHFVSKSNDAGARRRLSK